MSSERGLPPDTVTHIQQDVIKPAILCEMQFPSGTIRIWTGQGSLSWNSQTWTGAGDLIGFSSFPETTDGSSLGAQIILTGIDSSLISAATEDEFQGSPVSMWIAFIAPDGTVEDAPVKVFGGIMDTGEVEDNGQTANITINAESRLIDQLRPRQWRYTNEDQQKLYPGDLGLEFISKIQDKQIVWGAGG